MKPNTKYALEHLAYTLSKKAIHAFAYFFLVLFVSVSFLHYVLAPIAGLVVQVDQNVVQTAKAAAPLFFAAKLPQKEITLVKEEQTPKQQMLAEACQRIAPGDKKCPCINEAIFIHDSSWATAGVGRKTNNPGNMRVPSTWKPSVPFTVYHSPGNSVFSKFETLEDGITANVELYARLYKDLDPGRLVSIWAGGGGNAGYRGAVAACYNS